LVRETTKVLGCAADFRVSRFRAARRRKSACETGLGSVASGEGVLGLQRGVQLSGAKTTVTNLWKIPDRATMMQLM
jgi:hypothetical protein